MTTSPALEKAMSIRLSAEDWDRFVEACENPPAANERLRALARSYAAWETQHTPSLPSGADVGEIRKRHEASGKFIYEQNGYTPEHVQVHKDRATLLAALTASEAANDALLFALYDMRFMWGTHAEECNYVRTKYKDKCDCDWPKITAPADAAIIKATGAASLDEAISAVREKRNRKAVT